MANKKPRQLSNKTKKKIEALPDRKKKYIHGRLQGKSKRQAAKDAGYSNSVANHAAEVIETPDVTDAVKNALLELYPIEKAVKRVAEGMDAMETQTFCNVMGSKLKGNQQVKLTHVDKIAYSERRQNAALYFKLIGVKSMAPDVDVESGKGKITVVIDC